MAAGNGGRQPETSYPPVRAGLRDSEVVRSDVSLMPERMAPLASALTELGVCPGDRVLIMLPDGPGFAEALTAITLLGALPLPANTVAAAQDVASVAAEADAQLVLVSAERIDTLADLGTEPPALVDGPQGSWAAARRLP
jgi:acyl-CoA synthetase (AMP-forming)/AMP-acid ligase II